MQVRFKTRTRTAVRKKQEPFLPQRKKRCRFCMDKNRVIDYKDAKMLESFIRERGKILPSRVSGNCARHQRRITEAIKQARFLALLPYVRV